MGELLNSPKTSAPSFARNTYSTAEIVSPEITLVALATARADAQAMVRETTERLNAEAAKRQHELAQALAAETARAESRIEAAKHEALAGLREVAIEVAQAASLKVAGVPLDRANAGAAVDAVLRERA